MADLPQAMRLDRLDQRRENVTPPPGRVFEDTPVPSARKSILTPVSTPVSLSPTEAAGSSPGRGAGRDADGQGETGSDSLISSRKVNLTPFSATRTGSRRIPGHGGSQDPSLRLDV